MIIYAFFLNNILAAGFVITSFLLLLFFFLFRYGFDQDKELFEGPCQNLLVALWHFSVISPVTQRLIDQQSDYFRHLKKFLQHRSQRVCKASGLFLKISTTGSPQVDICPVSSSGHSIDLLYLHTTTLKQTLLVAALLQQGSKPQKVYDF